MLRPDDGVVCVRGLGALGLVSSDYQVDMERLLDRFADHATASSIGGVCGLSTDVLRVWEHSLAAGDFTGVNRLVVLARAIRAVDTRHGIAMIG
jgi:hypothetical protein